MLNRGSRRALGDDRHFEIEEFLGKIDRARYHGFDLVVQAIDGSEEPVISILDWPIRSRRMSRDRELEFDRGVPPILDEMGDEARVGHGILIGRGPDRGGIEVGCTRPRSAQ